VFQDRSSGRLIGRNYPLGSSPIRSRSGLIGSPDCHHSSRSGKYHQFLHPTKEHRAVAAKSPETTFISFLSQSQAVSRRPLLVNLPGVLCPLKHPPYPQLGQAAGPFVVPPSSKT
jgi:hypothetical protein